MTAGERFFLAAHQAHDAAALDRAWRQAARAAGWRYREIASVGTRPIAVVESRGRSGPEVYVSTGIHGDEPGPPWGLLRWFAQHGAGLREARVVLFPCLNPHGLVANTRTNEDGQDLNRMFHERTLHPVLAAWHDYMDGRAPAVSLCLHEDYDAQGAYCYELYRAGQPAVAADWLAAARLPVPLDGRRMIDGRKARAGVIRRSRLPPDLPGWPEAMALHARGVRVNLTFETPSEYSLWDRVRAHEAFVGTVVTRVLNGG
jgi:murein peptide amidase A